MDAVLKLQLIISDAIIPTQDKATVIGGVKVARGQRKGDRYIAAENDSFNSIIRALKSKDVAGMRKTLIESNPHLPLDKAAKANTPFKKGTVVYLTVKARDAAKAQRAKFECKGVPDEALLTEPQPYSDT